MRASPAAKVAAFATAAITAVYVIGAVVLNLVVARHLNEQNDDRLAGRLTVARQDPAVLSQQVSRSGSPSDIDTDAAHVFLWYADARGLITGHSPGAPALPSALLTAHAPRDGLAVTANRFHRATEHGPGAGLGLAIGDSIVRSTGGRWHVGDSPLGGALMSVSWRHSQPHRPAASRMMTSSA